MLVSEVKRLKGELEAARRQVAMLEESRTRDNSSSRRARRERSPARAALGAARPTASRRDVDKYKKQAADAGALRSITSDLKEAAASADAIDDSSTLLRVGGCGPRRKRRHGSSAGPSELSCCDTASRAVVEERGVCVHCERGAEARAAQRGLSGRQGGAEQVVRAQVEPRRRATRRATQLAEMTEPGGGVGVGAQREIAAVVTSRAPRRASGVPEAARRARRAQAHPCVDERADGRAADATSCGRSPQQLSPSSFAGARPAAAPARRRCTIRWRRWRSCCNKQVARAEDQRAAAGVPSEVDRRSGGGGDEDATTAPDALTDCALETTRLDRGVGHELAGSARGFCGPGWCNDGWYSEWDSDANHCGPNYGEAEISSITGEPSCADLCCDPRRVLRAGRHRPRRHPGATPTSSTAWATATRCRPHAPTKAFPCRRPTIWADMDLVEDWCCGGDRCSESVERVSFPANYVGSLCRSLTMHVDGGRRTRSSPGC